MKINVYTVIDMNKKFPWKKIKEILTLSLIFRLEMLVFMDPVNDQVSLESIKTVELYADSCIQ